MVFSETTPLLLRITQAVELSGLSKSSLYRKLANGEIAGRKLGRASFIERDSLVAFLNRLPGFGSNPG